MKSGSREIQQRMKQQVPRLDEPMKTWVAKAAKYYGCTYTKLENLYYRPGHSIPNDIYIRLRNIKDKPLSKHPHLHELKQKLEEQHKNITRLEKIIEREQSFKRRLGELLATY